MTAQLQVMKFGGPSVGTGECIARAAEIIAAAARERSVVRCLRGRGSDQSAR